MEQNTAYDNRISEVRAEPFTRMQPSLELEDTEQEQHCEELEQIDSYDVFENYRRRITKNPQQLQRRLGGWLSHNIIEENRAINSFVRLAAQS